MAEGRIKDPEGKQSDLKWGYIQRLDGPKWPCSRKWFWFFRSKKVIPFLNTENFKCGQLVTFDVTVVPLKGPISVDRKNDKDHGEGNEMGEGGIGIATNVTRKN